MSEKRYIKGLFKDTAHIDQPDGTWRFARNMVLNEKLGSMSNEGGTELAGHLGTDPVIGDFKNKLVGAIEVDKDRVVLFVKDVVTLIDPSSEIGIWDNGKYTTLFKPSFLLFPEHDLNFQIDNPVSGTFKIDSKGDLVVYFTDDLNPPRAFNISRQQRESFSVNELYGLVNFEHIDLLNLFPYAGSVPHIWVGDIFWGSPAHQQAVKEGGGLRTGVYYLALAYVDDDFVATNFLTVSNPIAIVDEFDHTRPTTKKDGMKEGSQTTKSITWRVSNLNVDYRYVRPVVIRKMGNAVDAAKLNDVEINMNLAPTPFQEITYSGIEGFSTGSVEEVIIDTTSYNTVKTIQQLDGILYLGNTTGTKDVGYQKYANNIKLNSVVKPIENFDVYWATVDNLETGFGGFPVDKGNTVDATKSYRYIPNTFKYKGYTRDEIYAFYIAFVMKDGSMSYAYHIPGRDSVDSTMEISNPCVGAPNPIYCDLENVSPSYSKMFHWRDYSTVPGNRNMNYWHNATEVYPKTDNYEVYDGITQLADLKNKNVRHHHFPSNWNTSRQTIAKSNCTTEDSDGIVSLQKSFNGAFYAVHNQYSGGGETSFNNANWRRTHHGEIGNGYGPFTNSGNITMADAQSLFVSTSAGTGDACNNGPPNFFTADQEMDVNVVYHIAVHRICNASGFNGGCAEPTCCQIMTDATNNGGVTVVGNNCIGSFGGCGTGVNNDWNHGSGNIHLMPGERIWVSCKSQGTCGSGSKSRMAKSSDGWSGTSCNTSCRGGISGYCGSWIRFGVVSTTAQAPADWYSDAKIDHEVNILGFELEDLKIPKSIADQVQGFRVYRAERAHSNRTILGQAPLMPMSRHYEQLGICEEAGQSDDVKQVLKTLQDNPEFFWHVDPWIRKSGTELSYSLYDEVAAAAITKEGYKNFAFHDFYLLNSKNSLSPATHIKPTYLIKNYAWNGTAVDQNKKPLTKLVTVSGVKKVEEGWGWDAALNCYPQTIDSAIFIGKDYDNKPDNTFRIPRLLGQKAKTYLLGDSIFEGTDLGFGGKIFNEFGTSCAIFGLKDGHQLPADWTLNSPDNDISFGGITSTSGSDWDDYGFNQLGHASILVNPDHKGAPDGEGSHDWRSQYWMTNLGAFKTDLYKSIDSNNLIWTGFEVLGSDLDNFVFDDTTGAPRASGDYMTSTIEPDGIFGGDTFLCRYGFTMALKPSNTSMKSIPRRSVHYQIVESTDNINFRHVESADSYYFPNTPARTMIQLSGNTDFNHQDNIKYNENYSEDNDIRTAFPLPLREGEQEDFPTRTHRSAKNDTTSLIDNYRIFLANQFKDLPKNRGELWKLSSFNNLLYFHMEESLFAAKGKQTMAMGDGSEAFVGSGDIFTQDPDELVQTEGGYAGTQSMYAALTTRFGYFFVDQASRKVFLMSEQPTEISNIGMWHWFSDNLAFVLEEYGLDPRCFDNPIEGMGLHSIWDPIYRRIILTKREFTPTQAFITAYNANQVSGPCTAYPLGRIRFNRDKCRWERYGPGKGGACGWWKVSMSCDSTYFDCDGWTISFYPELNAWGSFHDYVPYLYFNTSQNFYSSTDQYERPPWTNPTPIANHSGTTFGNAGIWQHNSETNYGVLYQENEASTYTNADWLTSVDYHPFEFEIIHNEMKSETLLHSSFDYTIETFNQEGISVLEQGFTDFWIYNTFQIYFDVLEYLVNIRRVGNEWKVNKFRDLAALAIDTSAYYMSPNINVTGQFNVGTLSTSSTQNMFIANGMSETINNTFINTGKAWDQQRKFIDKWVGIRLIYNNVSNNLLNLYSTNVAVRKMHR